MPAPVSTHSEWASGRLGEAISGTRSQTEFERKHLQEIQRGVNVRPLLKSGWLSTGRANDPDLRACCAMAAEDVDHPGKNATLAPRRQVERCG